MNHRRVGGRDDRSWWCRRGDYPASRPSLRPAIDPARRRPSSPGAGWFTDDIRVADADGILDVARLRSPHAHARIRSVSVDRAIKMQPNSMSPAPSTLESAHDAQAE